MSRRSMLLLTAVSAAMAMPAAPAIAGEDDSASLDLVRGCVQSQRAKLAVSGSDVDSVAFYIDGRLVKRVTSPAVTGRYVFAMRCNRLSVGAHRGRAVATLEGSDTQTLRFQLTRVAQGSPRFTG